MTAIQDLSFDTRLCWKWTDIFRAAFRDLTSDTDRAIVAAELRPALEGHTVLLTRDVYGVDCNSCPGRVALAAYRKGRKHPTYLCAVCATTEIPTDTERVEIKAS